MGKQIKQLPEVTTTTTSDKVPLQKGSNDQTSYALLSNLIPDSGITTAKIADDAVTAPKIDWASTGANGGIWWEELARTTLTSAGDTITVSSIPTRRYLMFLYNGIATGGTINATMHFNNDTGNNYARYQITNGSSTSSGSAGALGFESNSTASGSGQGGEIMVYINDASRVKLYSFKNINIATAGVANPPEYVEGWGKWVNTSSVINRIDWINSGTGDFAIGSEIVVLGHN